jgi:hypothetical protein
MERMVFPSPLHLDSLKRAVDGGEPRLQKVDGYHFEFRFHKGDLTATLVLFTAPATSILTPSSRSTATMTFSTSTVVGAGLAAVIPTAWKP